MLNNCNFIILNEITEQSQYSERSQLYGLEPLMKGTPFVESVSSYICRLAFEHNVDVTLLLFRMIVHAAPGNFGLKNQHSTGKSHLILGVGSTTYKIIFALEILTNRKDLIELTLLNWKSVVRSDLIKKKKHWCSLCFNEMNELDELYEPLIWQLKEVNYCLKHAVRLEKNCSGCKKEIPHIRTRMRVGYCPFCNSFLGDNTKPWIRIIPLAEQRILNAYSNLLSNNKPLAVPTELYIKGFINKIKEINPTLKIKDLSRMLSIKKERINDFMFGGKPIIEFWAKITTLLDVPLNLLLGNPELSTQIVKKIHQLKTKTPTRYFLSEDEKQKMKECMLNHLENGDLSINLKELAEKNKFDQRRMRHHFPDLYYELMKQSQVARDQKKKQYYENIEKEIRLLMSDYNFEPLSLLKMMGKFGMTEQTGKKYMPDLCEEIKTTFENFQLNRIEINKEAQLEEMKKIIYKLHEEGIYPNELIILENHSNKSLFRSTFYRKSRKQILRELGYD